MSEKRFVLKFNSQENEYFIRDNFEEEEELGSYTLKWGVRKLNEQQATISDLKEENEQLQKKYDNLYSAIEKTARDMSERMIYETEDFDVFQRITDYVEELDDE